MPILNFKTYGQGDPVIILHGLFGMLDNWHLFSKQLAKDYMVYSIDQRDHGKSPKTNDFSYELLAEDLNQFMEDHWIHKAHIIGHSMGGKTLMRMAIDYPEKINKGVVVDIGTWAYQTRHFKIMEILNAIDLNQNYTREEITKTILNAVPDARIVKFLMKNFIRKKEGGFDLKINLALLMKKYPEINKAIEGDPSESDMLFIKGGNSDYLKASDLVEIHKLFPNASMKTIPNASHWVHADEPKELLKEVINFLE